MAYLSKDKSRQKISWKFSKILKSLKYSRYFEDQLRHTRGLRSDVPMDDIAVTLTICKPQNGAAELQGRYSFPLRPYWKYVLRGETLLMEMHTLFKCSADFCATPSSSDCVPTLHDFSFFKYPSSFIFIHDTFYIVDEYYGMQETISQVDQQMLKPLIDLSEPIREWMKSKKDFGPTKVASFKSVKIKDLTCRLGFPYVYIHQGHCEHVFFFTDLRLMDSNDFDNNYPLQVSNTSLSRKCCACRTTAANWIVESESLSVTPSFMCDSCYQEFHFDRHGRRIADSQAYAYFDPSIIQY